MRVDWFYPRFHAASYREAIQVQIRLPCDDEEFRVSRSAYLLVICAHLVGSGIIAFGISQWTRLNPWGWAFILAGGAVFFIAGIALSVLTTSRINLNKSCLEYVCGEKATLFDLTEIEQVQVETTRFQGFILVVNRNREQIKIPLYFQNGPKLASLLATYADRRPIAPVTSGRALYAIVGWKEMDLIVHYDYKKLPGRDYWQELRLVSSLNYAKSNVRSLLAPDAETDSVAYIIRLPVSLAYIKRLQTRCIDAAAQEYVISPTEIETLNENLTGNIESLQKSGMMASTANGDRSKLILSGTIGDRILVGALCSMVTLFLTCICFGVGQWATKSREQKIWQYAAFGVFFSFAVFAFFGVVWAVLAPDWIKKIFLSGYHIILFSIAVVTAVSACAVLYFAFGR